VIDAPMNRRNFEAWVESQLAPTLKPGDMVILDNLSSHMALFPHEPAPECRFAQRGRMCHNLSHDFPCGRRLSRVRQLTI
jgi:hypothetical protein